MLWDRCLSVLSVCPACNVGVLWPNGWMDQDELGVEVGLGPDDIVLNGDPAPPPQRGTAHQFSAHVCCGQTAGWIKMPPGRSRPRRHCVRRGPSLSLEKGGTAAPHFLAHVYCGQTARWIKMPLGMEEGLAPLAQSSDHTVLDGTQLAPI